MAIFAELPGKAVSDQDVIEAAAVGQYDCGNSAAVAVSHLGIYRHLPLESMVRTELLGLLSICLVMLRAVDTSHEDLFRVLVMQDSYCVTVSDADNGSCKLLGAGSVCRHNASECGGGDLNKKIHEFLCDGPTY